MGPRSHNPVLRTVVTFYNPIERRSTSLTVYSGDDSAIARDVADHLARTFRTTKLDDRRHKRRL